MPPQSNKTKIIATVGPACRDNATLASLIEAGVSVFRLNFSHGTLAEHAPVIEAIRNASAQCGMVVAIMGDLCGPKIRLGNVHEGAFDIAEGHMIEVEPGSFPCTPGRICTSFEHFCEEVRVGDRVLIDDGQIRLRAIRGGGRTLACRCEIGGTIRSQKGINLPDTPLSLPALTRKDRDDLAWAVKQDIDYVALSFVRSPKDIEELRYELRRYDSDMHVIAKIERPEAVKCLDEIIDVSDAILVARGDLGVEMDVSKVPLIQKNIVYSCARSGRPVIVATQMLQTMVNSPVPTRAEVSDVANAILDGADAVMLSAETSVGCYPVDAVRAMREIADHTEDFLASRPEDSIPRVDPAALKFASAVAHGTSVLARELRLGLISVWTDTGATVRLLSKRRISQMIVGLNRDDRICQRMALYYGVRPLCLDRIENQSDMLEAIDRALLDRKLIAANDIIMVITGTRLRSSNTTNAMLIHMVENRAATPASDENPVSGELIGAL